MHFVVIDYVKCYNENLASAFYSLPLGVSSGQPWGVHREIA